MCLDKSDGEECLRLHLYRSLQSLSLDPARFGKCSDAMISCCSGSLSEAFNHSLVLTIPFHRSPRLLSIALSSCFPILLLHQLLQVHVR